ncbi:MAG TPA: amidase family protein [Mycobacteriales bacterium]|jgi:Asp-tRNA(Asn)/Glu-tRNA(Gln) amidotransferase A subunit family amidase|nr:amidase family protein [Mycobacteriales bacterium]
MTSAEQMTVAEVVAAIKAGDLTAADVAEAIIDRHNARNADVEAFAYFDPDQIRSDARELDAASEKGSLHGVPVGLKDVINTKDMRAGTQVRLAGTGRPGAGIRDRAARGNTRRHPGVRRRRAAR